MLVFLVRDQGSGQLTQGIVTGPKKWSIAQRSVHRPKKVVNGPRKLLLTIIFPLLLSFINCLLICLIVLFLMLLVFIFLSFNHWFSYCLSLFLTLSVLLFLICLINIDGCMVFLTEILYIASSSGDRAYVLWIHWLTHYLLGHLSL